VSVLEPDGSVNLSPRECALLIHVERDILTGWHRDALDPPDLVVVLGVMREAAARARLARPAHRGVVPVVSKVAALGFVTPESVVTVKEAAERLGISEQAVTKAIREGRLSGSRVGRGAWEISAGSVDKYTSRCSNRPGEAEPMTEAEVEAFKRDLLDALDRVERLESVVRDRAEAS
jgi:excisionase family DNA binding protein